MFLISSHLLHIFRDPVHNSYYHCHFWVTSVLSARKDCSLNVVGNIIELEHKLYNCIKKLQMEFIQHSPSFLGKYKAILHALKKNSQLNISDEGTQNSATCNYGSQFSKSSCKKEAKRKILKLLKYRITHLLNQYGLIFRSGV